MRVRSEKYSLSIMVGVKITYNNVMVSVSLGYDSRVLTIHAGRKIVMSREASAMGTFTEGTSLFIRFINGLSGHFCQL